MDYKDIAEQAYKNGYEHGKNDTLKEVCNELCVHSSTYVMKWIREKFGIFVDDNINRCVCCGEVIPEGRQVCLYCETKYANR